jgi:hypothetical protein
MNQLPVFNCLNNILKDVTNLKLQDKLSNLEDLLKIDYDGPHLETMLKLLQDQKYEIRTVLKLVSARKTRTKKDINPETRCMARIGLGTQCSRSHMNDSKYCKSHILSLPYGNIHDPEIETKIVKKRGRQSKVDKEYTVDELDMNKYVQALLIVIEDKPYLLDQNNILYQHDTNNVIVGRLVDDDSCIGNVRVEWY